ncbi:MAG: DNA cytosine methyltransferase [Patescibacteria group bacterium]|nr:DNA cytosine methyltransferase [Patescibacteria group bacterium]
MNLRVGSICSGIGAPEVAWKPLGWQFEFCAEIEPFPCAVLAHRHPEAPNWGDMTSFKDWNYDTAIDVLVGGTPCQSFSVAGLRKGLDDPRGNLMLTFGAIAAKYRPRWVVFENVPGLLSSSGGKDFASFLGMLTGQTVGTPQDGWRNSGILSGINAAYGCAWRVLDAQYAGLAQRRERLFVVGHIGGQWQRAAAVLPLAQGLRWNPAPSRKAREGVAPTISARTKGGGGLGTDVDCDGGLIPSGFDASEDGTGRGTPLVAATLDANYGNLQGCSGQDAKHGHSHLIPEVCWALQERDSKGSDSSTKDGHLIPTSSVIGVRRLMPHECEKLQGFPPGYTQVPYRNKPAADGPRYKALGNSMAVPVMGWIGKQIELIETVAPLKTEACK